MYYKQTLRFPAIKNKFCVFFLCAWFHPASYPYMLKVIPHMLIPCPRIISIRTISAYDKIFLKSSAHSAYYPNTPNFIPVYTKFQSYYYYSNCLLILGKIYIKYSILTDDNFLGPRRYSLIYDKLRHIGVDIFFFQKTFRLTPATAWAVVVLKPSRGLSARATRGLPRPPPLACWAPWVAGVARAPGGRSIHILSKSKQNFMTHIRQLHRKKLE
jgi:hypothetical protein